MHVIRDAFRALKAAPIVIGCGDPRRSRSASARIRPCSRFSTVCCCAPFRSKTPHGSRWLATQGQSTHVLDEPSLGGHPRPPRALRRRARVVEHALQPGAGRTDRVRRRRLDVSGSYFDVLGVRPILGRTWTPPTIRAAAARTARRRHQLRVLAAAVRRRRRRRSAGRSRSNACRSRSSASRRRSSSASTSGARSTSRSRSAPSR